MAVNTAAKRASATQFVVPIYAPGIFPDGTIAQGDRQAIAWIYGGILAEEAAAVELEVVDLTLWPRSTDITLHTRSTDLTIDDRSMDLTLKDRSTDLTIDARSTDLTLEDR